jgi:hypothetical protein
MTLSQYLTALVLAGSLFSAASNSSAIDKASTELLNDKAQENFGGASYDIAAVDYCYAGSAVDPATGEQVDLFVLCSEDGMEQNIDLA